MCVLYLKGLGWILYLTAVESHLVLYACLLGTPLSFKPLQTLCWVVDFVNSLSVSSLYCKKIKSLTIPRSWSVTFALYFPDCERSFWEFCWNKMITLVTPLPFELFSSEFTSIWGACFLEYQALTKLFCDFDS